MPDLWSAGFSLLLYGMRVYVSSEARLQTEEALIDCILRWMGEGMLYSPGELFRMGLHTLASRYDLVKFNELLR